jgi:glutaredoxin
MEVILAVTKPCHHCPILEGEFKAVKIPCEIRYVEDHPELIHEYGIQQSPNIIVDGKLVFRGMPGLDELRKFFSDLHKSEGV